MFKYSVFIICLISFYAQAMETTIYSAAKADCYILAGNISKTITTIGIFGSTNNKLSLLVEFSTKTPDIADFTQFITQLLDTLKTDYAIEPEYACFGVPGNPSAAQNFIQPFNISFAVDAESLYKNSNFKHISVVNDFEVIGYGINVIDSQKVIQINAGVPRTQGAQAIVGAGDGLGSALMIWDSGLNRYKHSALGFCYADFIAHDMSDIGLMEFIKQTSDMSNVSWGYMLGLKGGIKKMYNFVASKHNGEEIMLDYATPQDVFDNASQNLLCADAVHLYMKLYIRLLRNVMYTVLPYGGLYITNSVVEKNPEYFTDPSFLNELLNCNNEQLAVILKEIPIYIVLEPKVKLYGAAHYVSNKIKDN